MWERAGVERGVGGGSVRQASHSRPDPMALPPLLRAALSRRASCAHRASTMRFVQAWPHTKAVSVCVCEVGGGTGLTLLCCARAGAGGRARAAGAQAAAAGGGRGGPGRPYAGHAAGPGAGLGPAVLPGARSPQGAEACVGRQVELGWGLQIVGSSMARDSGPVGPRRRCAIPTRQAGDSSIALISAEAALSMRQAPRAAGRAGHRIARAAGARCRSAHKQASPASRPSAGKSPDEHR